jgi:hypothetical protein
VSCKQRYCWKSEGLGHKKISGKEIIQKWRHSRKGKVYQVERLLDRKGFFGMEKLPEGKESGNGEILCNKDNCKWRDTRT